MTYLSARKLGITTAEREALIKVAEIVGASPFVKDRDIQLFEDDKQTTHGIGFNLGFIAEAYDCGTSCCVGGHVSLHMQGVDLTEEHPVVTAEQRSIADKYVVRYDPDKPEGGGSLSDLYYPTLGIMDDARPGDAVQAIRNFLTTGKSEWRKVINDRMHREAQARAHA